MNGNVPIVKDELPSPYPPNITPYPSGKPQYEGAERFSRTCQKKKKKKKQKKTNQPPKYHP
jgi:hypothetical protein